MSCIALITAIITVLSASDIVIVKEGVPAAEIIIPEKPTRSAQMAAYELQHVVKLITGGELLIVKKNSPGKLPIYVGCAEKGTFKGEKYQLSVSPTQIRLEGNDTEDYTLVDYKDERTFPGTGYNYWTPRQIYNFHSTMFAVYDFLEILCGVRFYSFGDLGIALEKRKTLAVKPFERIYEPQADAFRYSTFSYRDQKGAPERDQRLLRLRWRMNRLFGEVNHTTDSLIWRYWGPAKGYESVFIEKRPQYFIQGYEKMPSGDSRTLYPGDNPPPAQVCTSHPDVIKYFAGEANEVLTGAAFKTPPLQGVRFRFLKKMEDKPFYYPIQEGDNQWWCKCENCNRLFPQIAEKERYSYIHYDFINRVQREAKKINPEIKITTAAYHDTMKRPDPKVLTLEKDIAVHLCLGVHSWMHPYIYNRQHKLYKEWIQTEIKNRPLFIWTYMLSPESDAFKAYKYIHFFPVQYPWKTAEMYKEFVNDGVRGVFLELSARYNQLEGYIAMRTAFDPNYDTEALIDEYFRLYYRESAVPMKAFFKEIETITWNYKNYPPEEMATYLKRWGDYSTAMGIHTQKVSWSLGTPERMAALQKIVDQANALAKTPEVKARMAVFMKDIWEPAREGRAEYDKRLDIEKNPLPNITPAYFAADQPEKIVWKDVRATDAWWELNSREPLAASATPILKTACGNRYFFINYSEPGDFAFKNKDKDYWHNNVEIFFGETAGYPYNQLAVGPNGVIEGYRRELYDGSEKIEKWNSGAKLINHELSPAGWSWTLAVPRRGSALETGGTHRINFIRTRQFDNHSSFAWSFLAPNNYAAGIHRMGYLHIPEEQENRTFDINNDFNKKDKKGELVGWRQNTPPLSEGNFYELEDHSVTLTGAPKPVHFMVLPISGIRYGDKVIFEFTASGQGDGFVGLYLYSFFSTFQNWRWRAAQMAPFKARTETGNYKIIVDTSESAGSNRDIISFRPFIGVAKGAKVTFSNIKISYSKNTVKTE